MSPEDLIRLVDAYRDETLGPEDARRMADTIRAGGPDADRIMEEIEWTGLLARSFEKDDEAAFLRSFEERLRAEGSESDFVKVFEGRRSSMEEPTPSSLPAFRARRRARRGRTAPFPGTLLGWMAAAAAALVALTVLLSLPGRRPTEFGETPSARKNPLPEAPPAPVPPRKAPAPPVVRPPAAPAPRAGKAVPSKSDPEKRIAPPENATPSRTEKETKPAPEPKPLRGTRAAVAVLESVSGTVRIFSNGNERQAARGETILTDDAIETGAGSSAAIVYADATKVEVDAETRIEKPSLEKGKRLLIVRGTLRADITRQPRNAPMVFTTPHGEATVLGTSLRLLVNGTTRLDVSTGRVRLRRKSDGRAVLVAAGHYAVAAEGTALAARPFPGPPRVFELETFGTARGCAPADRPVKRAFLEPLDGATGGTCVAVPGEGTTVSGTLRLDPGDWHLWVRYRNEDRLAVSFEIRVNGKTLSRVNVPLGGRQWLWKRVTFRTSGATAIALRSTSAGVPEPPARAKPGHPYDAVNRWDVLALTQDGDWDPRKR